MATVISCVNFCEGATNYTPIKKVDGGREENGDIMHWIYYTSKNLASRLFYVSSGVSNESSTEIQFSYEKRADREITENISYLILQNKVSR